MSVLEGRHLLQLPAGFLVDPAAASALLQNAVKPSDGGGKMLSSFRISDLLEKREANEEPTSPLRGSSPSIVDESLRGSPSEDSSPTSTKKARKARTIFTDKQLQELESTFEKQKYLSVQDRMDLAHRMGLSDTQVKTWYQNRRTKWKRQAAVGIDLLAEPSNLAAVQQLFRTNPYWAGYLGAINPLGPLVPPLGSLPHSLPLMMIPPFPVISHSKEEATSSTPDS